MFSVIRLAFMTTSFSWPTLNQNPFLDFHMSMNAVSSINWIMNDFIGMECIIIIVAVKQKIFSLCVCLAIFPCIHVIMFSISENVKMFIAFIYKIFWVVAQSIGVHCAPWHWEHPEVTKECSSLDEKKKYNQSKIEYSKMTNIVEIATAYLTTNHFSLKNSCFFRLFCVVFIYYAASYMIFFRCLFCPFSTGP